MKRNVRQPVSGNNQPKLLAPWSMVVLLILGLMVSTGMMPLPMAVGTPAPSTTAPAPTVAASSPITTTNAITTTTAATATKVPPTATQVPPTATKLPPTATKVPPTATKLPPTATTVPAGPEVPILIKFKSTATAADIDAAIKGNGGKSVRELKQIRTRVINVPANAAPQVLAAYAKHASVERATAAIKMKKAGDPNDPGYAQQWALPKIDWNNAYGVVTIAGSSTIAVLDTGVDATHPDFAGRIVPGFSAFGGDPNIDPNGHGTSMAGIAAANVNNNVGMAGVAYTGVSIMPVQVLQSDGTGYDSDVVAGVLYAADNGGKVILMGFYSQDYSAALADALAYAYSKGAVLVAATGNDGATAITYPAGMPNVIGVAATDQNDNLGANSNTGSAAVAAPGVGIYTTLPGGGYGSISGTSASSAHVAGLAALLTANGKSNVDASNQIRGATDPVNSASFGRINVAKALGVNVAPPPTATPMPATPTPGATPTYRAGALGVSATYNADTATINATGSGQNGNKRWQYSYTPPGGGTVIFTPCKSPANAGTDSLVLPAGFAIGSWTVTLDEYNNQNQCQDNGGGQPNKTTSASTNVNVTKGNTVTGVSSATGTYGGTVNLIAVLNLKGGAPLGGKTINFTLNGTSVGSATTNAGGVATLNNANLGTINVGAYGTGVGASFAGDSSYNNSSGTNSLTVNKATLTVTPDNQTKVYASADPLFTFAYAGFKNSETSTVIDTPPTCGVSGSHINVGAYTITCGGGFDNNYTFSFATATLTITKKSLTPSITVSNKVYDGSTSTGFTCALSGVVGGDIVVCTGGVATFDTKNVGTGKTVTALGLAITGPAAGNYQLSSTSATTTADITPRPITVTAATDTKTYDGATSSVGVPTITTGSLVSGETATWTQRFDNKNAGTGKTLTPAGSVNDGNGGHNYNVTFVPVTTGIINPRPITVTADPQTKVYGASDPALTYQLTSGSLVAGETFSGALTRVAGENVGAYAIQQDTLTAGSNYAITYIGANLTITKAPLTVTAKNKTTTYGDADPTFDFSYNGIVLGDIAIDTPPTCSVSGAHVNVGTYVIVCANGADNNYTFTYTNGTLTVNPASLTIKANDKSKVYGSANPSFDVTYTGFVLGENAGVLGGALSLTTPATANSDVGTYDITPSGLTSSNYSITFSNGTLTVTPASLTVQANDKSKVYGSVNPAFDVAYAGFVLSQDKNVLGGTLSFATTATTTSPVGTYAITPSGLTSSNYHITFADGTLTITKASLSIKTDDASRIYGDANPAFSATGTGLQGSDTLASLSGTLTFNTSATTASPVGTYAVTPGGLTSGNYAITFVDGTLTVTKATLTITADNQSREYGDANPALTASYAGFKNSETLATSGVTGSPSLTTSAIATSPVSGSPYTIAAAIGSLASSNYQFTFVNGALSITRATLSVKADDQSREYGDANPAFSFQMTGFKNGESSSVLTTQPTCSTTATQASNAGAYPITCAGGAAANYGFAYTAGTLTVNKATLTVTANDQTKIYGDADPTFTFAYAGFKVGDTLAVVDTPPTCGVTGAHINFGAYPITCDNGADNNYKFTYVAGTLTITKRAVTVTADAQSKIYGDADPALTYKISSGTLATGDSFTGALSRAGGESVGAYAITQGTLALNSNYTLTFAGANLTIGKRAITVTADAKSKTYGDADPALTYQITSGSLAFSDAFAGALTRVGGENVGTYAIQQGTLALNANYDLAYAGVNLTIAARAITITADAKTKVYGDADPALSYQITNGNLVNGDAFTGALSRASGENVGAYAINQHTLALTSNYALTYVGANLTITQATLTVTADSKTIIYGDAEPAFTLTYGAFKFSDAPGVLDTPPTCGVAVAHTNAGTYTIKCAGGADNNYAFSYTDGTLTINQRALTITADAKSKVYGNADPALTYKITSGALVNGDSFSGSLTRDAGESVGAYAIKQGNVTAGNNYNLTFVSADLNITARPITVTAEAQTKVYGNSDPALTYHISSGNLVNGDAFTGALTRDAGEIVGSYAVTQGTLTAGGNYALTFVGANLAITVRPITITADAKSKIYGDADPALTYQITAGSLAFSDAFTGALTRATGENIGTYAIAQGTVALTSNYTLSYISANLTIEKRAVTVTADPQSKTYGESDPALTYKITAGSLAFSDAFAGALKREAGESVGTYTIQQDTLALNSNYDLTYVGASFTIGKRPVTITADAQSKIYGESDPALTYQITAGSLAFSDAFAGSLSRNAGENVGAYAINQNTVALNGNYVLSYIGANLSITARPIEITAEGKSKVYGETDPALTYHISKGTLVFGDAFTGLLVRAAGENVGDYAILQGSVALTTNYTLTYIGANFSITKKPVAVSADAKSKVYGETDPAWTYTFTPALINGDSFTGALMRAAGEDVGAHAIQQGTLTLGGNYEITYHGADLTITKRPVTITAEAKEKIYGDADPALTYKITSGSLAFSDGFTGALTRDAGENVGAYAIKQGAVALSGNYDLSYVGANLTIAVRPIAVTADPQSKIYGDGDPALTYQITSGSLAFSDGFSGALTRTAGENIGTYAIQQGTLALSANYALTFNGANLTINKRAVTVTADAQSKVYGASDPALTYKITSGSLAFSDAFTGALARVSGETVGAYPIQKNTLALNTNYVLTYVGADLTITRASLTVTPADKSKTYGDSFNAFTGAINGIQFGDNISASYSSDGSPATATVGDYDIVATLSDPDNKLSNYDVTLHKGKLTVNTKALTVTANDQTKTYGDAFTFGGTEFTTDGLVNGNTVASVTLTSNGAPAIAAKGSYAIVPSAAVGTGLSNYAITYANGTFTVNAKALTVTAGNRTKTYGETVTFAGTEFTSNGLVNGDAVASVTLTSGGASATANVGDYNIVPSAATGTGLSNYTISYTNGTLTVEQKSATVSADAKTKTYGDDNPALMATIVGTVNGDTLNYSLSTTAVKFSNVGDYAIEVALGSNPNYRVTPTNGNLHINAKVATVTADGKSKTYGDDNPALTATVVGQVAGGDAIKYSLFTTAVQFSGVGDYPIVVTLLANPNYSVTKTDGNLHINPKSATVTADGKSKIYGDDNPALTAIVVGQVAGGDVVNYTLSTTAVKLSNVGDYSIAVMLGSNPNYSVSKTDGNLHIDQKDASVTANNKSKVYGEDNPALTATVVGQVTGGAVIDYSLATTALKLSPVGDYNIAVTLGTNPNYNMTKTDGTLTINRANTATTAAPKSATFGDASVTLTANVSAVNPSTASVNEGTITFVVKKNGTTLDTLTSGAVSNGAASASLTLDADYVVGSYDIYATYNPASSAPNFNSSEVATPAKLTIGQKSTTLVLSQPANVQYSDPITLVATVNPALLNGQTIAGSVEFFIGNTSVGAASVNSSGVATLSNVANLRAPGSYAVSAKFTSANSNFTDSNANGVSVTVTQEDARAFYTGNSLFWGATISASSANVALSATIKDITAVSGDSAYDASAGDIRNAKVTFVIRNDNGAIVPAATCADLVPSLVNATEKTVGTVSCNTTLSIATEGASQYTVGIQVTNYYLRTGSYDSEVINVAQPLTTNFITGGGYLVMTNSAGQFAGDLGTKSNYGFNVKYNKSGSNLQGHVNLIIRKGGRVYQIKSNSLSSLVVTVPTGAGCTAGIQASPACPYKATFSSKANLTDITDPNNPVSVPGVGGGLTLQMQMTDKGEPGSTDSISFTLWDGNKLLFASNWNGTKTMEQLLGGGNLVVH